MVWYDNWPVWHKYDIFLIHNVIPRRGSLCKSVSKSKNWFEELTLAKGPRFKNYLIWTGLTDSEQKKLWDPANAYFSIWGISPGWLEKFDQLCIGGLPQISLFLQYIADISPDIISLLWYIIASHQFFWYIMIFCDDIFSIYDVSFWYIRDISSFWYIIADDIPWKFDDISYVTYHCDISM